MKTLKNLLAKFSLNSCLAIALIFAVWLTGTGCATNTGAEQMKPMKGGEHLLMLNPVNATQDLNALKTDDTVAMVCAKCKTVWTSRVKQGVKGAQLLNEQGQPTELVGTHACQGCSSTLTVVGHAKGDIVELKHSCKACGDDSAFCCATKPGSGATKGMEKEKK